MNDPDFANNVSQLCGVEITTPFTTRSLQAALGPTPCLCDEESDGTIRIICTKTGTTLELKPWK